MKRNLIYNGLSLLLATAALFSAVAPAQAQDKKPNILFIMGDDIGWMQPSIYHRGLMVGETPNIDRIGNEGGIFMHYYAESSCTAGRCVSSPACTRTARAWSCRSCRAPLLKRRIEGRPVTAAGHARAHGCMPVKKALRPAVQLDSA